MEPFKGKKKTVKLELVVDKSVKLPTQKEFLWEVDEEKPKSKGI